MMFQHTCLGQAVEAAAPTPAAKVSKVGRISPIEDANNTATHDRDRDYPSMKSVEAIALDSRNADLTRGLVIHRNARTSILVETHAKLSNIPHWKIILQEMEKSSNW
jgi:hypothetical protein